jgi:hypothetical protein
MTTKLDIHPIRSPRGAAGLAGTVALVALAALAGGCAAPDEATTGSAGGLNLDTGRESPLFGEGGVRFVSCGTGCQRRVLLPQQRLDAPGSLVKIEVKAGQYIDSLKFTWVTASGDSVERLVGGSGGGPRPAFELAPGEVIVRVEGRAGKYVDGMRFTTNFGNVSTWYGGNGGAPFDVDVTSTHTEGFSREQVQGFLIRAGSYIDQIGFLIYKEN